MKFAFFGTPDFAAIVLDGLEAEGYVPSLVVAQPDRPKGRGKRLVAPPVALWAKKRGIPLLQPAHCRDTGLTEAMRALGPDVAVTAAFGQILPQALLDIPASGFINVHPSLLPKYRGASPVQAALLSGDRETGVTLMQVDKGLDTGPVIASQTVPIDDEINAGALSDKLAGIGGRMAADVLKPWVRGGLSSVPQDGARAVMTHRLQKEDGLVDFSKTARDVHNRIRAMAPWPGAYALLNGGNCKLLRARVADREEEGLAADALCACRAGSGVSGADGRSFAELPGMIAVAQKCRLFVRCGSGWIELLEIQMPSKAAVPCRDCAHNFRFGSHFEA